MNYKNQISDRVKILLIDEDESIFYLIRRVLLRENYRLYTSTSGRSGMEMSTSICPDLILMDTQLSDMDGIGLIQWFREWTDCPILVVSGQTGYMDKVNALYAGADDYIVKPFHEQELAARIYTALRRRIPGGQGSFYQAGDLKIDSMEADGLVLTIHTTEACPSLMNYLSEPYGCIIDVDEGVTEDGIVVGTGPFVATELVTDDHLNLVKNENYWDGNVNIDEITVRTISDGDTLALALQSGEINATYGMAYASYPVFENDNYQFTSVQTSRSFYVQMNYTSPVVADDAVREAIAMGIDKDSFVNVLLNGYGYVATGAFPDTVDFGGSTLNAKTYDPEGAKAVLEAAGWKDSDGDGIREKDGQKLTIKWLTYPSRQELPLLAESAQSTLKEIGMDVQINATADHNSIWKDASAWDVYVGANVNCGLGDPTNFFSTHCLDASTKNRGQYHSDKMEELAVQLNSTFDTAKRNQIAIEMQQQLLDDNAFVFCSFLKMSMISQANVTGLTAHACDYYELTADLDIN